MTTEEQAKKRSLATPDKKIYVVDDEVETAPLPGWSCYFLNGEKITTTKGKAVDPIKSATQTNKVMATKKKATKKAKKETAPKGPKVEKLIRGNNMALTKEQWAKVDKKRGDVSFSEFSRSLVLKDIGE